MNMRRAIAAALFVVACLSLDLSADADTWVTWESPASQAQDALTDQPWISTDVASEVSDAVLPLPGVGERYIVAEARFGDRCAARSADLTRAPPSA